MHANANYPYDSLIPPKNKNEGLHFRADTGVRPYAFKFLDVGVTPRGYPPGLCMEGYTRGCSSGQTQGSAPTPKNHRM